MKDFVFISRPLFWITIFLGLSFFSKKKKWKIFGVIIFLMLTNNWLGFFVLHLWEYQTIEVSDIQKPYDIGLVLSHFIYRRENKPNEELIVYMANHRFSQAIELYKKGKFKKFFLSGDAEMDSTITFLLNQGIPSEDIMYENQSLNTYENALFSKQFLDKNGLSSNNILLITSASHMRRAKKCFDAVGLSVTPFSVDHFTVCSELWKISFEGIIPNDAALVKWRILFREWMSMLFFKLKGYI